MNARTRKTRIGIAVAGLVGAACLLGAAPSMAAENTATQATTTSSSSQEAQPVTLFTKTVKVLVKNQTGSDLTMNYQVKSSGGTGSKVIANGTEGAVTGKSMAGSDLSGTLDLSDGTTIKWSAYNPEFGTASVTINGTQYNMSDYSDIQTTTVNGHKVSIDLTDGTYKQFELTIS